RVVDSRELVGSDGAIAGVGLVGGKSCQGQSAPVPQRASNGQATDIGQSAGNGVFVDIGTTCRWSASGDGKRSCEYSSHYFFSSGMMKLAMRSIFLLDSVMLITTSGLRVMMVLSLFFSS